MKFCVVSLNAEGGYNCVYGTFYTKLKANNKINELLDKMKNTNPDTYIKDNTLYTKYDVAVVSYYIDKLKK